MPGFKTPGFKDFLFLWPITSCGGWPESGQVFATIGTDLVQEAGSDVDVGVRMAFVVQAS